MLLKEILKTKGSKVWSVKTSQTIQDTIEVLVNQKIGAVLVLDESGMFVGIISERDIMRVCHHHRENWAPMKVKEVMTKKVIVGTPDDSVQYIMGIMTQNRVRHIPVVEGGQLAGIVSIGDIVKAQLKDTEYENRYLKEYLYG